MQRQRSDWSSFFSLSPLSMDDLDTLKSQANDHPPLATSPHPKDSPASSAHPPLAEYQALQYTVSQ